MSGKVAKKEHTQIVSVLKYIQELPPGLYGMEIHETTGADGTVEYDVTLHERKLEDLKRLQKYDRVDEKPFEAVAALSELDRARVRAARAARRARGDAANGSRRCCANCIRCACSAGGSPTAIRCSPAFRTRRTWRARTGGRVRRDNAGRRGRALFSEYVRASLDLYRDLRDATSEAAFFEVYGNMLSLQMADQRAVIRKQTRFDARALPAVRQVLDEIDQGGLPEAIVRTGLLLVKAGGGKRKLAQMEHTRALLAPTGVLRHIDEDQFRRLLHEQTLVVEFEPVQAKRSLVRLVRTAGDRQKLNAVFDALDDDSSGLDARQRELLAEFRKMIPRPAATTAPRSPKSLPAPARAGRQAQAAGAGAADRGDLGRVVALADGPGPATFRERAHRKGCARRSQRARRAPVGRADAALDRRISRSASTASAGAGRSSARSAS